MRVQLKYLIRFQQHDNNLENNLKHRKHIFLHHLVQTLPLFGGDLVGRGCLGDFHFRRHVVYKLLGVLDVARGDGFEACVIGAFISAKAIPDS